MTPSLNVSSTATLLLIKHTHTCTTHPQSSVGARYLPEKVHATVAYRRVAFFRFPRSLRLRARLCKTRSHTSKHLS